MSEQVEMRHVRVCECGKELERDGGLCPECGAEWAGKVEVWERKRERRRKRTVSAAEVGAERDKRLGVVILILCVLVLLVAVCVLWPDISAHLDGGIRAQEARQREQLVEAVEDELERRGVR